MDRFKWEWFKTIYQFWILWRKKSWTFKTYIDLQNQVIFASESLFQRSLHILEDGASGVQIGDIEQVTI